MVLKKCRKAEVYDLSDNLLCAAEVTRASLDGYRLIVPADFELSDKTGVYKVVFFDGVAGLIHTVCVLGDPLNISKEQQSIACVIREEKGNDQRRSDLKVPVGVLIEVRCIRKPAGFDGKLPVRIPACTTNISAGGVYFVCEHSIPADAHIQFELHESSKPLQLTASVLRVDALEPLPNGKQQFGHGCRFINMKAQAEAELRSYIFRQELALRRKECE